MGNFFRMFPSIALSIIFAFSLISFVTWILIPKFLETPSYRVELSDSKFQIRNYDSFAITQIGITGKQNEALRAGFGPLVRFIGAKERLSEKIAMTVPVMQAKTDQNDRWLISFSMPSKYNINNLPKPVNANLSQETVPEKLMAVIKFNGRATEELLLRKESELSNWVEKQGYKLIGSIYYYFYNDPLTPGVFRRNEVLIEVSKTDPKVSNFQ